MTSRAASDKALAAALEWDPMYVDGGQPFGPGPFGGIDEVLRSHVKLGGKVLDIGAGYGRDSLWLARELSCAVTALEPGNSGVAAIEAAVASGGAGPGSVSGTVLCASEFDFDAHAHAFDAVLMDSVLQFISEDLRGLVIAGSLKALAPGGSLIVVGWPNEEDPTWVGKLVSLASVDGVEVVADNKTVECDAVFDGEEVHMVWSVTVAQRGGGGKAPFKEAVSCTC